MKALLLSLVFGLLVASQGDAHTDASQFTGRWLTHYIAANNIEKITEGAPFHIFMRYIEFDEENGTIHFRFYVKNNGECIEKYVSGIKENHLYSVDYAGHNEFQVINGDQNNLITHNVNVDEQGKETEMVGLFGKGNEPDSKYEEEFKNAVREKGIPEENILNFFYNDDCPEE
ncbi:odorant-binding protein-like [Moschus berezovskii]|uniref:odorant-binding protein-like n=1 Tax=Moschus berezovskii TaxID=68408 RepID=UPI002444A29C|nr:odorant-binding protein-like [Moschus berezovskii]